MMNRRFFLPCAVALGFLFSLHAQDAGAGMQSIFNGKDLTGWTGKDAARFWKVVDGVLTGENDAEKKGSMLYTEKSYADFELEADVRWNGEIDSGFMMRKPELQLQIGVSRSLKRDMTGSFYVGNYPEAGQAKEAGKVIKQGDWNRFKLKMAGPTCTVWINGTQVSSFTDAKYAAPGPIGLQIHGGLAMKVEFRGLQIHELK